MTWEKTGKPRECLAVTVRKDLEGRAGVWECNYQKQGLSKIRSHYSISMGSRERENREDRLGQVGRFKYPIQSYSGKLFTCDHPETCLLNFPWKLSTPWFSAHPYYVCDLKRNDYVVAALSMYVLLFIFMSKLTHTAFLMTVLK